jgi:hypothetical protein
MVEGRSRALWEHTAAHLAMHYNIHRDPKRTRPRTAQDFNPHCRRSRQPSGIPLTAENIRMLKTVFVDRKANP